MIREIENFEMNGMYAVLKHDDSMKKCAWTVEYSDVTGEDRIDIFNSEFTAREGFTGIKRDIEELMK
ncbi:MAG: hypothetical protein ABFD07_06805 [Methanobacterium sp.]